MSVLKSKRTESKAEYVNLARQISVKTLSFLSRLSARYSRTIGDETGKIALRMFDETVQGNDIFPGNYDDVRWELREQRLAEARSTLAALDANLALCYEILMLNPEGCFAEGNGKKRVSSAEAQRKLENMAQELGDLINQKRIKLSAVMKSDKERRRRQRKKASESDEDAEISKERSSGEPEAS